MSLARPLFILETTTDMISDLISDRAYLAKLTEKPTYPCLVNVLISDIPDGLSHEGETNVYLARWQVDAYAQAFDDADDLAKKVTRLFVPLNKHSVADTVITSCRRITTNFFHESALDKWRFVLEFEFRYSFINMP